MIKNKTTIKRQEFLDHLKDPTLFVINNICKSFKNRYPFLGKNLEVSEHKIDNAYIITIKIKDFNRLITVSQYLCNLLYNNIPDLYIDAKTYGKNYEGDCCERLLYLKIQ